MITASLATSKLICLCVVTKRFRVTVLVRRLAPKSVADASCKHRIAAESSAEDHRVRHHASEFDAEREVPGDGNTPEHQQLL
ncbi:hypothetical protein E4U31_003542 [Claviceps sp. LM219 group G6]|nr:hypothetical protein E4U31_003542 [Claviceps sp. LM219 group G6]